MGLMKLFETSTSRDFFNLLTGRSLGTGAYREVFELRLNPEYVVKMDYTTNDAFSNVKEWLFWEAYKEDKKVSEWLAPCVSISSCGICLIQKRTEPARRSDLPDKVPGFCTDLKIENWGLLDGKPVMHDYGSMILTVSSRLKKAEWWSRYDRPALP